MRLRTDAHDDAGFSIVEVMVAIGLIGVVMASLGAFYVNSLVATNAQAGRQVAVQTALDGMEKVRATDAATLLAGRTSSATTTQWNSAPAAVTPYLASMTRAWNNTTGTAVLPLSDSTTVNSVAYQRSWYVGTCWQPTAADAVCTTGTSTGAAQMFRVVVAVTWSDRDCGAAGCAYVTSTLVSPVAEDPIFNVHQTAPPNITPPGAQTSVVNVTLSPGLQLDASGGAPPMIWEATGLPPGLSIDQNTGLITGRPTQVGTYNNVDITVRDSTNRSDTERFSWTITPAAPRPASPGPQVWQSGITLSPTLQLTVDGGAAPITWVSATGLPTGLQMSSSGRITGTPSAAGTFSVTVQVRDNLGRTGTTQFDWTIRSAPNLTDPGDQQVRTNSTVDLPIQLSGGTAPFSWTASNLPNGLTIDQQTGRITGRITRGPTGSQPISSTVTVTDTHGARDSVTFDWAITAGWSGGHEE